MTSTRNPSARRFEEAIRTNLEQLSLGQKLVLSPSNAMDLRPEEIVLERCTITHMAPMSLDITVRTEAGQEWIVAVDYCTTERLYLGGVSYDRGLGYRYWAFLSEENFWMWREWYILTTRLNDYIAFTGSDLEELPTERNLQIARILYDVLANGNLGPLRTVTFEPLSDSQLDRSDE